MALNDLGGLHVDELKESTKAERRMIDALPEMAEAPNSPEPPVVLADQLTEIQQHLEKVYQLLKKLGANPGSTTESIRPRKRTVRTRDRIRTGSRTL